MNYERQETKNARKTQAFLAESQMDFSGAAIGSLSG